MTNLQQYAAEIIVNNETGETFMSQRALARVCDVGESTIRAWKNSAQKKETKEAEILTGQGLRTAQLFSEQDIAEAQETDNIGSTRVRPGYSQLVFTGCLHK